ncbi:cilia- and flagella-associated protein 70 isoform X4 [Zonotrichia leucophrys gambelii]|uniref:cilia- and flagella-associated protein 70 isoform X4 n=1 Tax=Zonotrichia leucophrys gambelii TaxID=257770 RepID=UPI0031408A73
MSQPIPVQITVVSAQDLKTLKSSLAYTLVRVEYNGAVLGDSSKTHVLPDGTAEYDFSSSFEYSPEGPNSLDILVQKPVLLTLLEVTSKDKKKPDKITPLAQAVVDLLPLLQGARSLKVLAPLYAVPASPSAKLCPEATAGLEVIVSTRELLLSATDFSSGNLLSVTVEAAYSVPDAFTADSQQNYMVCLQMPAAAEKELPLLFKNGLLKAGGEKEPFPRPKNWPVGPILAPNALNIPDSFIVGGPYEDEDGDLNKSEDKEFRTQAESSRRVVWDMETRCFLDADAVAVLQMRIAERRHWPVELCRMSTGGKGKGNKPDKKDEDKPIAFHGVAYVNMMHLLCPGVTQIRGAFRVFNYEDSEVFEKTRVQYSIFRDRRSQLSLGKERLGTSPSSKAATNKPLKEDSNAMVVEDYHKRVTSVAVAILREYHELFGKQLLEQGVMDHETMEEQKRQLNYELNTSGKYFAFKEQLKYSVVKIVREKYLKTTAFETKEQLQAFLSELYVYLVDHMHMALNKLLSGEDVSPAPPPNSTSKQLLLFAREAEAIKDLKLASLFYNQRIARDQRSIQAWLDYGAFCLLYEDATKAQECFQQAVCLDPQHVQSLLLCGIACVKLRTYEEAEIFFEDACSLEPPSIIAWTLTGLFYEMQNNYIQAERSFREAKKLLRAELEEERRILEAAEAEGKKPTPPSSQPAEEIPDGSPDKPPEVEEGETPKEEAPAVQEAPQAPEPEPPPCTIFMKSVEFLMQFNSVRFVHKALAHELLSLQGGPTCAYYLALGWTYQLREDLPRWEECLREAVRIEPLNPNVWAQKGHLCYQQKDFDKAKDCYERVISFEEDAADMHFVYLRLGSIYLDEKKYARAKHIFLLACDNSASCLTWLGVGIACYRGSPPRSFLLLEQCLFSWEALSACSLSCVHASPLSLKLEEMLEAEDALSEANALNNTNPEVWGYLALICLQGGRQLEAEQCYKYTVKLGLKNNALLHEIREAQQRYGFGDPSL